MAESGEELLQRFQSSDLDELISLHNKEVTPSFFFSEVNSLMDDTSMFLEFQTPIIPDFLIRKTTNSDRNPEDHQCIYSKIFPKGNSEPCKDKKCTSCTTGDYARESSSQQNQKLDSQEEREKKEKERINRIIEETAKNSEYYIKEEKKKKECAQRVKKFKNRIHGLQQNTIQWVKTRDIVSQLMKQYLMELRLDRTWIYIDMDMFFAAVEIRDQPDLETKPIAVSDNQMIMTANYLARKTGVKSGMPKFIGVKLCPEITFLKANYTKYRQISDQFKSILAKYDSQLESQGLDEASLDVTDFLIQNRLNDMDGRVFIGQKIKKEIFEATRLTGSCGIAPNKLLAKICSGIKKPNGLTYLDFNQKEITSFMNKLPIGKITGIGKVHERVLQGLGIKNCKDLIEKASEIYVNFSENQFQFFVKSALGIDRNIHEDTVQKSIGVSQTFKPITEYQEHHDKIQVMATELYERLKESNLVAKTCILEFKTTRFEVKMRSTTFQHYIHEKQDIINAGIDLLKQLWPIGEPVRLIGVRLMHLRAKNINPKVKSNTKDQQIDITISNRNSNNSEEQNDSSSRQSSAVSLITEEEQQIKPEQVGLCFDRARMNSSNRKAIDHFKKGKGLKDCNSGENSQGQVYAKPKENQFVLNHSSDKKIHKPRKNKPDITKFLKNKEQKLCNSQGQAIEFDLDYLLGSNDPPKEKSPIKHRQSEGYAHNETQRMSYQDQDDLSHSSYLTKRPYQGDVQIGQHKRLRLT